MKKFPFKIYPDIILRIPLKSISFYHDLLSQNEVDEDKLTSILHEKVIQEAIYLASPSLYQQIMKWKNGEIQKKKKDKLFVSILKYLKRLSSRCTPFGLFAGVTIGELGEEETDLEPENYRYFGRHTRLDMNFLIALTQNLSKRKHIRDGLNYSTNSSIYSIGKKIRFVEYRYVDGTRIHEIVEVDRSKYLDAILNYERKKGTIDDYLVLLMKMGVQKNDARLFIEQLIESQILVNDLEPALTQKNILLEINQKLAKIDQANLEFSIISRLIDQLNELDYIIGNNPEKYKSLEKTIQELDVPFKKNFLFQVDMQTHFKKSKLSNKFLDNVQNVLSLFNKITGHSYNENLTKFKEAFIERYEMREVELAQVLDNEFGLGYPLSTNSNNPNPLIDDLILFEPENPLKPSTYQWTKFHDLMLKKLEKNDREQSIILKLKSSDFTDFNENWGDIQNTFSILMEILVVDGEEKVKMTGFGGSTASYLLGRFAYNDKGIEENVMKLTEIEKDLLPDGILAEILHLPQDRVGNVLLRPSFTEYEIPYLSNSSKSKEFQIPISDLTLSIRMGELILYSKTLKKRIRPRLSNAHNYRSNSLPIYHFLCDLQSDGKREWIGFNLGSILSRRTFIPRIEYSNVIVHEATWRFGRDIIEMLIIADNKGKLVSKIIDLRTIWKIPEHVKIKDGENELPIKLTNISSLKVLMDDIRNRTEFTISEYLHTEESVVHDGENRFANEMIISFYRQ